MNPIIYEHEAHKLAQPTCRYCGLPLRWGKGYGHVDGFEETGVCGSRWFPDYPGKEPDGKWSRSSACREIVRLRISQLRRMADYAEGIKPRAYRTMVKANGGVFEITRANAIESRIDRFRNACLREIDRLRALK